LTQFENNLKSHEIIAFYNSHPSSSLESSNLPLLSKAKNITILGNGNVALDVARIIARAASGVWGEEWDCEKKFENLFTNETFGSNKNLQNVSRFAS